LNALLDRFARTFQGVAYQHRSSTTGDRISECLFEDLLEINRSPKLIDGVTSGAIVLNRANRVSGQARKRRGDGTFGERAPSEQPTFEDGFRVGRAAVAEVQIGVEMKIMAKAMIKQVERVQSDLVRQSTVFRQMNSRAISVGIVGVNFAEYAIGYEGAREFRSTVPPSREAPEVLRRLDEFVRPHLDELIVLKYKATNEAPFLFDWVGLASTEAEYSSALVRISNQYQQRF
jgi:hypothetical protein